MRGSRIAGPLVIVALAAGAGLAGAAVAYDLALGTHTGSAGGQAWFVVAADSLGSLLALLFSVQLVLGYGFFTSSHKQLRLHSALAWLIIAILLGHGTGGAWHAFQPPREAVPIQLVYLGLLTSALVGVQVWDGRFRRRSEQSRPQALRRHVLLGLITGGVLVLHVVLGTIHGITG